MSKLQDKQYRMSHLFWIRTKVSGFQGKVVTFNPNRFQRRKYNLIYQQGVKSIIELKSRKFGTTTGWCIDNLDECAYQQKYFQAITMAHSTEKSQEIFHDIVKFAWNNIGGPKMSDDRRNRLRPHIKYNNKSVLDFDRRGSKYIVTNDAKGSTPNRLHVTEAAYFKKDEDIVESFNALPEDAVKIAESTAYGMGNWFEIVFNEAWHAFQNGEPHEWYPIFHPWFDDPNNRVASIEGRKLRYESEAREIQEKFGLSDAQIFWWDKKKQTNRGLVYQFYPCTVEEAFLHSGRPVFDQQNLLALKQKHARDPIHVEDEIQFFAAVDPEANYGIGVDTAEGLEHGDRSIISVVRRDTGDEVAQVAGAYPPHKLAEKLDKVATIFPNHLCVIERNNHGHAVIAEAKRIPHLKLFRREVVDKVTEQKDFVIGWDTNEKSKAYMISTLSRCLEDGDCVPQSAHTYLELQYYVHGDRGIMGALPGKHDDRVIALALANLACERMVIVGDTDLSSYGIF